MQTDSQATSIHSSDNVIAKEKQECNIHENKVVSLDQFRLNITKNLH